MALRPIPSPSSGGSHSPSPELPSDGTSANTSPASSATPLHAPPPSDEGEPSSSSTPTRAMSDLTRSSSAGKGGCWTCRVRRKKCDEEREGDSCKTCLRLRIKCLGWGPKRPDWMRDKDKVAAYKASIKEQLSRMGLIRGQPRQPWHSAGLSTSSQPSPPGVAGPGPQTTLRGSMSERETTFRRDPPYVARGASAPYHVPRMTRPISEADQWGGHNISASSSPRHHQVSPMAPLLPTPPTHDSLYGFQSPPLSMGAGDDIPYGTYIPQQGHPQQGMPISMPPPVPAAPPQPTVRKDEYISYYFKYVRELQYVFAGELLANLLLPIVQSDPDGPVALSLCALAALHHGRAQMARSNQPILEDPDAENSLPRQFYNRALYHLMHSPQTNGTGQYSDADAVAAVQLVAYSLLGGGSTDWATPLDYACEWLAQTGIYNEENPKLTLLNMSAAGRFAAKATMYSDIFASITLMQPPRFLSLYKRLFGGGAGFWASRGMSPRSNAQHSELRMDALSGCPDEALLAIAEISALAHWKATELQSGSLSMRELIRRGDAIERELRDRATGKSAADSVEDVKNPAIIASPSSLAAGLDVPAGMAMAPSPQPGMGGRLRSTRSPIDTTKHIIGEMFREAALLYLHTVLSDSVPGVPEIMNGVDQMAKLLNELAPSSYDRTVIFPLFLTGCLTDNQMMREVIKHRFFMQDATNGNVLLAQTVMEEVWAQRTHAVRTARQGDHPRVTDWRQHLRLQWASLLLA
ncbi:fungal-specific transcription factor domain-containing protein [Ganoderma leucocontextum]|nr:fungal-specific transcription factor domain-containing protein [Ganoderma leucocontextum]